MGKWRLLDKNPRIWFTTILLACLLFHMPSSIHSGQPVGDVPAAVTNHHAYSSSGSSSTFYLTGNVTVKAGNNYTISNENLRLESLYETTLKITVYGNLSIANSRISLDNASYSKVLNFSIYMEPGSRFNLQNSTLVFPGALVFTRSYARLANSTVNTSISDSQNPYDCSLRISSNHSQISIWNSTVNGLYRQSGSYEFMDGYQYLYNTPYSSSNSTIPMTPASHLRTDAYINSAVINVTYSSKYNESNSYLKIGYAGNLLEEYRLPYNLSETQVTQSFRVNFSGIEHNLTWMESNTNFYLISVINSQTPITIYNISEFFNSNDTVSLYGSGPYSYNFSNSNVTVFNSSLGLNEAENVLGSGQSNPGKIYMDLNNSTLVLGDSSLLDQASYNDPFFLNHNSRIFFLREIKVAAFSHSIPVQDLRYSVSPTGSENLAGNGLMNSINSTGSGWIYAKNHTVVYEMVNLSDVFSYAGTFSISSAGSTGYFSVSPFPSLVRGPLNFTFNSLSVPYSIFGISGFKLYDNGSGEFELQWNGNLSALGNLNLSWELYNSTSVILKGTTNIRNPGSTGSQIIHLNSLNRLEPGNYDIKAQMSVSQEHAFNNSGLISSHYFLEIPAPMEHEITILRQGSIGGKIWGVSIGNSSLYSNGSTIYANITGNATAKVIEPGGYGSSPETINLTASQAQYNITFFRIQYNITFQNGNMSRGSQWELIIAGSSMRSENATITVALQPGSYNYEVVDPQGYALQNSTGIIHVDNSSFTVNLISKKIIPLPAAIEKRLSLPEYYLPIAFASVIAISIAGWNGSHTWYVCKACGSTRKRKRKPCPYCGEKWSK